MNNAEKANYQKFFTHKGYDLLTTFDRESKIIVRQRYCIWLVRGSK